MESTPHVSAKHSDLHFDCEANLHTLRGCQYPFGLDCSPEKAMPNARKLTVFQLDNYRHSPFSKMLSNIAPFLIHHHFEIDLLTASPEGLTSPPRGVSARLVGHTLPGFRNLPKHYLAVPDLVRYFNEQRPGFVLAQGLPFAIPLIIARRFSPWKPKLLLGLHISLEHDLQNRTHRSTPILPFLARYAIAHSDATFAVSRGVACSYSRIARVPYDAIRVIHNPVFTEELLQLAEAPVDHTWAQNTRAGKLLLSVGRLAPEKDHKTLLLALARLAKHTDVRLLILGDGPLRPELEDLARQLNIACSVRFLGRVVNPIAFMARADALVLSSRYEGFANVIVEAMAAGCPVVSTDCEAGPREILADGYFGPLVAVGDSTELASAIARVLSQPLPKDQLVARAKFFSAERSAEELIKLTDTLTHQAEREP